MVARGWEVFLASNEYGNDRMLAAACDVFDSDPTIDYVVVNEHGGWRLSYNRDGVIVGTANDRAVLSEAAREWASQFDGASIVGYSRRDEGSSHKFDDYYPCVAVA